MEKELFHVHEKSFNFSTRENEEKNALLQHVQDCFECKRTECIS